MKFLQIGLGSMGKRRIRCLQALGETGIVAFDPREDRREEAERAVQKTLDLGSGGLSCRSTRPARGGGAQHMW